MCRSFKQVASVLVLLLLVPFQAQAINWGPLANTFCSAAAGMVKLGSPLFKASLWQGFTLGRNSKIMAAVALGVGAIPLFVFASKRLKNKIDLSNYGFAMRCRKKAIEVAPASLEVKIMIPGNHQEEQKRKEEAARNAQQIWSFY